MIRVMGAGAFGTALAVSLAERGPVTLWARDVGHAQEMARARRNDRRLPGIDLPDAVTVVSGPIEPSKAEATLLAVPAQTLRSFCTEHAGGLANGAPLVTCCKGVELATGLRPSQVIAEVLPGAACAVLTGPSFAGDIARGLPTALTLACADAAVGQRLQAGLSTSVLRLYRSSDVIGAELGGALKNVIAIASGAAMGAGLGDSARAALMTRGFAEIVRAAEAMGAARDTLSGLSGFGDLVLTCTSEQSRNYRFGLSLGRNEAFDPGVTVEGAATAQAVCDLAAREGLDLPITQAVMMLVSGRLRVEQAMDMLLKRPLKEE
ncbi:NAD(P)H-dependent glycerol-3-phosphate dehydrogenase [Roseovarius amoyensis]|uniref:NAD(P)H-dependent glycerol-3-phosphate dehydrogenase n=1 Tax=Roseovarius amoyensis TaxID=2211448 RepID=UPI000DBE1F3C|nr:NAD(P)H-dependent glycerol-3-phosphate dehydrogenase [Roseovarius amoyensis]